MEHEFREPRSDDEWAAYYRLRWERLRKPLGEPEGSERDDPMEPFSSHVIVLAGARVIAGGCWVVVPTREGLVARYRQAAVDPEFEGHGLFGRITDHVEQASRDAGAARLLGNTRVENLEFFERRGWVAQGEGVKLFGSVDSVTIVKELT